MDTLQSLIANHPFAKGLEPRLLRVLAESAMEKEFAAGEVILREGDGANRFYLILSGSVAIEVPTREKGNLQIQRIGAGEVLGWSWLFPPHYWNFNARAVEPTRAIFFYGTRLRGRCDEDADLGYELMKRFTQVMVERLQFTRSRLFERKAVQCIPGAER